MFDPEKIERMVVYESKLIRTPVCPVEPVVGVVLASDYDQLLERCRRAEASREAYAKGLMTMRQPVEV